MRWLRRFLSVVSGYRAQQLREVCALRRIKRAERLCRQPGLSEKALWELYLKAQTSSEAHFILNAIVLRNTFERRK